MKLDGDTQHVSLEKKPAEPAIIHLSRKVQAHFGSVGHCDYYIFDPVLGKERQIRYYSDMKQGMTVIVKPKAGKDLGNATVRNVSTRKEPGS